jgi:alpha-L-fucosidase 2
MTLQPFQRARQHPITFNKPAVDFFDGALLGNGGLGVVVTTRPDSVLLHFGHNNVWDIRIAENHKDEIGTFAEIFEKVKALSPDLSALEDDPWYNRYLRMTEENYNAPYPHPFPCGSLLLSFDRRKAELMGHRLDISVGLCEVLFNRLDGSGDARLQIFTDMQHDRLWLRMVDAGGQPTAAFFERVRLLPDPETPREMPPFVVQTAMRGDAFAFSQVLPFAEPDRYDVAVGHPQDRAVRLAVRLNAELGTWQPQTSRCDPRAVDPLERAISAKDISEGRGADFQPRPVDALERAITAAPAFLACVQLDEGLAADVLTRSASLPTLSDAAWQEASSRSRALWEAYWNQSGVALDDEFLERVWYWNLYFFNCAVSPNATCPGLFANWSYRSVGATWHGDYHMNYNTQQPFWLTFSSNHVEKHLAYVNMVDHILPISRKWAREYYGLRGAYFPHSAFPVEMNIMPYPAPSWGWEVCETPWTVQSLWWHYTYTMDVDYLRSRAFEPIREAVQFLADYMMRPEARWDDQYHIFPTVSPELYCGLTPGLKLNYDCLVDLTLTKFVFRAYLEAITVLGIEAQEADLAANVQTILDHFPAYPTADSPQGTVFVSVPGEDPEVTYNTPNSTMTVFPGDEHGLHSPPDVYAIASNSYRQQRNEGGNELVFLNMQGARLGQLDLERFKRQIRYCMLPNGTCSDYVLQVHGRYQDTAPYDYMGKMGVWFENFALPAVINECLLHSYSGTMQLFPNWSLDKAAEFHTLRAVGGFLVSAACADGTVQWVRVVSEAGGTLRLISPWKSEMIERATQPGEVIMLTRE